VIVGVPVQVPSLAVSVEPVCTVPAIDGSAVLAGALAWVSATSVRSPGMKRSRPLLKVTVALVALFAIRPSATIVPASKPRLLA
jgi:hypothetical protein